MNKIGLAIIALLLIAASVLAFNPPDSLVRLLGATDVTAAYAKSSSAALLASLPDGSEVGPAEDGGWKFSAPDGNAEFTWNWNPSAETAGAYAAAVRTPAAPFLAAGLNPSLMPEGVLRGDELVFGFQPDQAAGASTGAADGDPASSFARLIDAFRDRIGYHIQLQHFGLDLGGGNLLEWARDPIANSLDLVFVLDPEPFLRAGVDKDKVEGWIFGSVIVHDAASGRRVEVPKFLKPFNLQ